MSQNVKEMSLFLKQLLGKEEWIKELNLLINEKKSNKKIKNIDISDNKLLAFFWSKYSVSNIDVYKLFKEIRNISLNNLKKPENDYKLYLSIELSIFLTRLIKLENKLNFNQSYDFLAYEFIQFHDVFNSLINMLDKLNLTPIIINLTKENKGKALKISKAKKWTELDSEDIEFYSKVRKYSFKNGFYKKFNLEIDKVSFYEIFLLESRNQFTHYPSFNYQIGNLKNFNIILFNLLHNSNNKIPINTDLIFLSYKRGIILATLYLFLVYEEMLKNEYW